MQTVFIDPGALRSELVLEAVSYADDGAGGQVESWSEVATLFGHVAPAGARSTFGAGQTLETTTHRVTLRFRDDVASGMRLRRKLRPLRRWKRKSRLRIFDIVTVHDPDETGRYLVCRVREKGK